MRRLAASGSLACFSFALDGSFPFARRESAASRDLSGQVSSLEADFDDSPDIVRQFRRRTFNETLRQDVSPLFLEEGNDSASGLPTARPNFSNEHRVDELLSFDRAKRLDHTVDNTLNPRFRILCIQVSRDIAIGGCVAIGVAQKQ